MPLPRAVHAVPGWRAPAPSAASGPWLLTSCRVLEGALGAHTCGQMGLQGRRPGRGRNEGCASQRGRASNQMDASGAAPNPARRATQPALPTHLGGRTQPTLLLPATARRMESAVEAHISSRLARGRTTRPMAPRFMPPSRPRKPSAGEGWKVGQG